MADVTLSNYAATCITLLEASVSADICASGFLDLANGVATTTSNHGPASTPESVEHWARLTGQHTREYWARASESPPVVVLDDVIPNLERQPIYQEYLRPLHMRHQVILLASVTPTITCFALSREDKPFSNTEIARLTRMVPRFAAIRRNVERFETYQGGYRTHRCGHEWHCFEKIHVSASGHIVDATEQACRWLTQYVGPIRSFCHLPSELTAHTQTPEWFLGSEWPLAGHGRLLVYCNAEPGGGMTLLLKRHTPISDEELREAVGLSPAEYEVMVRMLRSPFDSNKEIQLSFRAEGRSKSPDTVKTQMKSIRKKLKIRRTVEVSRAVEQRLRARFGNYR